MEEKEDSSPIMWFSNLLVSGSYWTVTMVQLLKNCHNIIDTF